MARRWYQNVDIESLDQTFEDTKRKNSKFWNEGKWHNFIKPLLPKERGTFIEIGCNAGLFLKMAVDAGFRDVIGVEASSRIMNQAEHFKKHNKYTYKLLQRQVGKNLILDELPVADVTLLANVHYYFSIPVLAKLVDGLRNRTLYCIVVSAKARRRQGLALYDLRSVRGYFSDWREIEVIEGIEEEGDPAPRVRMYGALFRGNLDALDVESTCNIWRKDVAWSDRHKHFALPAALEEFFQKVLSGEAFNDEETLLYQYWRERRPKESSEWVRNILARKKLLAKDIQENGIREPIYYDRKGELLDGAHRLAIARELGYKHILIRRF